MEAIGDRSYPLFLLECRLFAARYKSTVINLAGVEGRSTGSTLILLNDRSETLTTIKDSAYNFLLIGEEEYFKRIHSMINQSTIVAILADEQRIDAV